MKDRTLSNVVLLLWVLIALFQTLQVSKLKREVRDLREYIAAGSQGHYQGEGEQP